MILRPYQTSSIDSLRDNMRDGHIRQVLAAPCGAGKSVIAVEMIKLAVEKGSRCMFICERRVLVEQFSKHLDAQGIDHGILMAKHWRWRPEAAVQVCSAQTLEKMEFWPAVDIVFIDELHAAMRKSVLNMIVTRPKLKIIGLTATPFHPAIPKHFSEVVSVISMRELVDIGNLVPFRVFIAHEIDVAGVKTVAGEWKKDELEKRGQQIVGNIVADYIRLSNEIFGGYRKTICFSCGVNHGAELVQHFQEAGINSIQITYKDSDEYKADVLADFARKDTAIQILVSTDILTRGFDQTDVEHIILARPLKKSFSSHVQMIGRGARSHPEKEFCIVQDNAGNWLRFRDSWEELFGEGIQTLQSEADAKSRKEPTLKQKEAAKCPKCSALWPFGSDTCAHCGHVRQRRNDVQNVPGQMLELTNSPAQPKYDSAYKERFYSEMLGYCRKWKKNEGAAYYWYQTKFGMKPAWKKVAAEPSREVSDYCLSRLIAYAKGKK